MTQEPCTMKTVNYEKIADEYDKRFEMAYGHDGVESILLGLVRAQNLQKVLEVGCGTGHWLDILHSHAQVLGIDLSLAMLQKAISSLPDLLVIRGEAIHLPFSDQTFDMVFCVNALHHFSNPSAFISEAYRLLEPNGVLGVIGMNPHTRRDRWFIYDYFPGTYEVDLQRYPSPKTVADWMESAGFEQITEQVAERLRNDKHGYDVLPLSKEFTSQLSLLSMEDYEKGIARIEEDLYKAQEAGKDIVFPVDVSLFMVKTHAVKQKTLPKIIVRGNSQSDHTSFS
jgi:ubiquinone/menaquinone biosynthesis C-methylase UbiE